MNEVRIGIGVGSVAGNPARYAYDRFGNLAAVTNALGNAIVYEYDLRGRKTYEGGATYPVRYTYDVFGNKVAMTTYRAEGAQEGDVTQWLYDEASNCMTNKVYADGNGTKYEYDANGRLAKRTWARGIDTFYAYDGWGNLTNTTYSDDTPTVALWYDALGRQVEAHDAAGVTTFAYDAFGANTNETVVGVAGTSVLERFTDEFGRDAGYALNGERQTILAYDSATGRLATMTPATAGGAGVPPAQSDRGKFVWSYLPGSDLKSSLVYPNGLTASWQYDANNQLLQVRNATPTNVISQFDYTYDAAGCRTAIAKRGSAFVFEDVVSYGYNARNELTNAVASVDANYRYNYQYDPIGNRETSFERGTNTTYVANELNQYSQIAAIGEDVFVPDFDDDGNQTLVKTATGIWHVTYNGENRPVLWTCGTAKITMSFDRMGRRVTKNDQCFVYNGYLQIANFHSPTPTPTPTLYSSYFIRDPTEPIATRPLVWYGMCNIGEGESSVEEWFYTHDGYKNVSEVVAVNSGIDAHYEYAPFGAVVGQRARITSLNPWQFSAEFLDNELCCEYYNYRHYNSKFGRWCERDQIEEQDCINLYLFLKNACSKTDLLGHSESGVCCKEFLQDVQNSTGGAGSMYGMLNLSFALSQVGEKGLCKVDLRCENCKSDKKRSGDSTTMGGYAVYDEKFRLFTDNVIEIHVRLCMDDSGKTLGGLQQAALTLNHELVHAKDLCRLRSGLSCGEFTVDALRSGKFDDLICTEIHAYSRQNRGITFGGLSKNDVIEGAVNSVLSGCEILKAKIIEDDFAKKLKDRVTKMYDKCKDWGGSQMSLTKKAQVNLFLSLSSFVVVFLGSLIGVCFLVQIRVRNMIRDDRHSVNPVSMTEDGAAGKMLVRDRDLFLFCFRNGLIAPARRPDTFYDFMGRMLCDFPVGTNRIFILADTLCSKRVVEEKMEDLCGKCSNEVYLVGKSFDLEADLVCERWKGSWAAMRLIGIGVDCSVIDRLFYISPFVCNPLLGWFGDRCGCVYDVQKPWRDKKGMRLLHGFKDGFESLNVEH